MKIKFYGSNTADLFSLELEKSLQGVIERLLIKDKNDESYGFVHTSLPNFIWHGTMWTRDAGTILREFVAWGHICEAKMLCGSILHHLEKNENGFYMCPEYFIKGEKSSGSELDGTASILIGMCYLYRCLEDGDETKEKIRTFLTSESSPIIEMLGILKDQPLLSGSGEFGGGCFIDGMYINVVQNNLTALALIAVSKIYRELEKSDLADECDKAAKKITEGIKAQLIDEDGKFIWCIDPKTMKPDPDVLNHFVNKGAGLINGVLCMSSDVYGLDLTKDNFYAYENGEIQFDFLYNYPNRKELFEKYGVWTQFNDFRPGATGPSYGQGYAMQCMILLNRMDMLEKALNYLANETYSPIPEFAAIFKRVSPYHFQERMYTPYSIEHNIELEIGCGELNIVNVSEPLKVGRMIAGIDISGQIPLIYPRMPDGIQSYEATDVPLICNSKLYFADICCQKNGGDLKFQIKSKGNPIPKLRIKSGDEEIICENVSEVSI